MLLSGGSDPARKVTYHFWTIDNQAGRGFNELLGINNSNVMAGSYGDGSERASVRGIPRPLAKSNPIIHAGKNSVQSSLEHQGQQLNVSQLQLTTVNNAGDIGGNLWDAQGDEYPWVTWTGSATAYMDREGKQLLGLNGDPGTAVVFDTNPSGKLQAYKMDQGSGSLTSVGQRGISTKATGINDQGAIVGFIRLSNGVFSLMWPNNSGVDTLLSKPGWKDIQAWGINDEYQVVGSYEDRSGITNGFVETEPGGPTSVWQEIHFPGATETVVRGINDSGDLVGYYTDSSGSHGFLAEPS